MGDLDVREPEKNSLVRRNRLVSAFRFASAVFWVGRSATNKIYLSLLVIKYGYSFLRYTIPAVMYGVSVPISAIAACFNSKEAAVVAIEVPSTVKDGTTDSPVVSLVRVGDEWDIVDFV
jgi:hypothetical protein